MQALKKLIRIFSKKPAESAPLLIIKQDSDDSRVKEFDNIEEAIADLENDPNIPAEKLENLKASLKQLKNKTSIKIRNGEIIK
ncbi:MAG: hypothetical protein WCW62_12610 [Bacteroidales bacterium]